jgi:hypothetical protein
VSHPPVLLDTQRHDPVFGSLVVSPSLLETQRHDPILALWSCPPHYSKHRDTTPFWLFGRVPLITRNIETRPHFGSLVVSHPLTAPPILGCESALFFFGGSSVLKKEWTSRVHLQYLNSCGLILQVVEGK